jgi:hypothetical protein
LKILGGAAQFERKKFDEEDRLDDDTYDSTPEPPRGDRQRPMKKKQGEGPGPVQNEAEAGDFAIPEVSGMGKSTEANHLRLQTEEIVMIKPEAKIAPRPRSGTTHGRTKST